MRVTSTECCGLALIRDLERSTSGLAKAIVEAQSGKKGYVMATLTSTEYGNGSGRFLLDHGFKQIASFSNPGTGSLVYVFGINVEAGKGRWVPA